MNNRGHSDHNFDETDVFWEFHYDIETRKTTT